MLSLSSSCFVPLATCLLPPRVVEVVICMQLVAHRLVVRLRLVLEVHGRQGAFAVRLLAHCARLSTSPAVLAMAVHPPSSSLVFACRLDLRRDFGGGSDNRILAFVEGRLPSAPRVPARCPCALRAAACATLERLPPVGCALAARRNLCRRIARCRPHAILVQTQPCRFPQWSSMSLQSAFLKLTRLW